MNNAANDNGNNGNGPDLDRIMARIRKCLATANDTAEGGEHERDNAMRAAHAIAAKYGLSIAVAEAAGTQKEEARTQGAYTWYKEAYAGWIAGAVAELFFCKPYIQDLGKQRCAYYFVGREANVTTASEMMKYLIASIHAEARKNSGTDKYIRNFSKGAALHIARRCKELRAEAERASTAGNGTSLVLASYYKNELEANQRFLSEQLRITLGASKGPRIKVGGHGYQEGYAYGGAVSLNRQVGGNGSGNPRIK